MKEYQAELKVCRAENIRKNIKVSFKNKKKHKLKKQGAFEKLEQLEEARFLLEEESFHEALVFLKDAVEKYPLEVKFWEMLAVAGSALENAAVMQRAFTKVRQLEPKNSNAWFGLGYAYLLNDYFALSIRTLEEYLQRFPDGKRKEDVLKALESAKEDLKESISDDFPDDFEKMVDLACLHDESQVLMNQGEFEKAKEKAVKLLGEMPDFIPARNDLSLIFFMNGEAEKAFETAQQILTGQPGNFDALANLVRFAVFLGRENEAQQAVERLLPIKSAHVGDWRKKLETFINIADFKAAAEVFKESEKADFESSYNKNFGIHLGAYAFYRLGKTKLAERLWRQILEDDPRFPPAIANLYELNRPKREQSAYSMPLQQWIPERYVNELSEEILNLRSGNHFEKILREKVSRFYKNNPNILSVLSVLLKYGDESAGKFAVELMGLSGTPESYAVLKDFAFSQNGTDSQRYEAAAELSKAGIIRGKARLWSDGQWRETMIEGFKITGAPTDSYPLKQKAKNLLEKGLEATNKGNFSLAEEYYEMAREANEEDQPSILYNLLAIKQFQGKKTDVKTELREIIRQFPEYPFAPILLATEEVKTGSLETAKQLVEGFYDKKIFHVTEAKAWAYFNLELALKEKDFAAARRALNLLVRVDETLDYGYWDDLIDGKEQLGKITGIPFKLFGRRK